MNWPFNSRVGRQTPALISEERCLSPVEKGFITFPAMAWLVGREESGGEGRSANLFGPLVPPLPLPQEGKFKQGQNLSGK